MGAPLRIVEVGPRDGLQNESRFIPTEAKIAYIEALSDTGLKEIESGAFVSPKSIPQLADSDEVFRRLRRRPGVVYSALVPNERGLERALAVKADKAAVFTAASESFNRKNINAGIKESIERFRPVVLRAGELKLPVRGYVSTAFHCPFEGRIAPAAVLPVLLDLMELGVGELSIGDTIGKASVDEVRSLLELVLKKVPVDRVWLHFHDTYGRASDNALAAWREFGVTGFDASAGGIGGCPYAPGAPGNVATERLLKAFQDAGAEVPADPGAVARAARGALVHLGRSAGPTSPSPESP